MCYCSDTGGERMSQSNSTLSVNVPTDVKIESTNILNSLGINMTTAINMFLRKVIAENGIPFELKNNSSALEASTELEYLKSHLDEYKSYNNVDDMFADILKED